jgi:tmRNA-binding protein
MWGDTLSRNDANKIPINAAQQPRTEKLLLHNFEVDELLNSITVSRYT